MAKFTLLAVLLAFYVYDESSAAECIPKDSLMTKEDIKLAVHFSEVAFKETLDAGDNKGYFIHQKIEKNMNLPGSLSEKNEIKVLVAENANQIIIAFRGTEHDEQLITQITSGLFKTRLTKWFGWWTGIKSNKYFYDAFNIVYNDLKQHLGNTEKRYILTGHSLGGALASLLAMEMNVEGRKWKNKASCLITFGQPRIGNQAFADKHDQLVPPVRKLRIEMLGDLVGSLPPRLLGYRHSNGEMLLYRAKHDNVEENIASVCTGTSQCGDIEDLFKTKLTAAKHSLVGYVSFVNTINKFTDKDNAFQPILSDCLDNLLGSTCTRI